jgi:hypothetical protein
MRDPSATRAGTWTSGKRRFIPFALRHNESTGIQSRSVISLGG